MLLLPIIIPFAGSIPLFLMKNNRSRRILTAVIVILTALLSVYVAPVFFHSRNCSEYFCRHAELRESALVS